MNRESLVVSTLVSGAKGHRFDSKQQAQKTAFPNALYWYHLHGWHSVSVTFWIWALNEGPLCREKSTIMQINKIAIGFYVIIWASSWQNLLLPYANNKGADQPAHARSLISSFVVHCLDSIIPILAKTQNFKILACLCSWAGQFAC